MQQLGIFEAFKVGGGCTLPHQHMHATQVKRQVLLSATEAAEMILRVDEIIRAAPRQRGEE